MMSDRAASAWLGDLRRPDVAAAIALADETDTAALVARAKPLRDEGHPSVVSYSRKVFIPLTKLCRDVCHYCTFATTPKPGQKAFLTVDEVIAIAERGAAAGCKEALFTLGDKPELRYRAAREELAEMGFASTLDYLEAAARETLKRTGLLPHLNPGVMTRDEMARLRRVSISQGIMLESTSRRLLEPGQCHHGSPDKDPEVRLRTIREAGELRIPFTSGLLIGIGESRRERVETLLALRDAHEMYGHIQEIIVQNFRAKPHTKMSEAREPDLDDLVWTIAVARLIFGPRMNIQAPPNLTAGDIKPLIEAGSTIGAASRLRLTSSTPKRHGRMSMTWPATHAKPARSWCSVWRSIRNGRAIRSDGSIRLRSRRFCARSTARAMPGRTTGFPVRRRTPPMLPRCCRRPESRVRISRRSWSACARAYRPTRIWWLACFGPAARMQRWCAGRRTSSGGARMATS